MLSSRLRSLPRRIAVLRVLRLGPFRKFWVQTYGPQAEYWLERLKELRWAQGRPTR